MALCALLGQIEDKTRQSALKRRLRSEAEAQLFCLVEDRVGLAPKQNGQVSNSRDTNRYVFQPQKNGSQMDRSWLLADEEQQFQRSPATHQTKFVTRTAENNERVI